MALARGNFKMFSGCSGEGSQTSYTRHVTSPSVRRVGLLGGTFDPPHFGHLAMADAAMSQLSLDEVRFVVAHEPWQKVGERVVTDSAIRLAMTDALVNGRPGLSVDDQEIRRQGLTYTVDTLEATKATDPSIEMFLIVGADTAERMHTWHRLSDVLRLSTLVIVNRSSDIVSVPSAVQGARHEVVTMDPVHVSSSDLRAAVATGASIEAMTSPTVQVIIAQHHLYEMVS